jgi:hypothetical protein
MPEAENNAKLLWEGHGVAHAARDSAKHAGVRVPGSPWTIRSRLTIAVRSSIGETIAGLRLRDRHVQHASL